MRNYAKSFKTMQNHKQGGQNLIVLGEALTNFLLKLRISWIFSSLKIVPWTEIR